MVTLNGTKYNTLNDALRSPQPGTIYLDEDMKEDVLVLKKNRIIDLNGHTLSNVAAPVVQVGAEASVTLKDSVGGGRVVSMVKDKPAVYVEYGGQATVQGGEYTYNVPDDANAYYVFQIEGTLNLIDGTIIGAGGSSAVTVGYYDSKFVPMGPATFNMSGGTVIHDTFIAVKCDSSGIVGISGGTVRAQKEAVLSWNDTTIKGGDITSTTMQAVLVGNEGYESTKGRVSIQGGNITGVGKDISGIEGYAEKTTVTITGGGFANPLPPEYIPAGQSVIIGADGKHTLISDRWVFKEGSRTAWGLAKERTILHRDIVQYVSGGVDIPTIPEDSVLVTVTAKGGVNGYLDHATGKLLLYRGNKEVTGTLEDVTVVFLHF